MSPGWMCASVPIQPSHVRPERAHPGKTKGFSLSRLPLVSACAPRPGNAERRWERAASRAPLGAACARILPRGGLAPTPAQPRAPLRPRAPPTRRRPGPRSRRSPGGRRPRSPRLIG